MLQQTSELEDPVRFLCQELHFDFLGLVGQGGFKETYKVTTSDSRTLALKIFKPESNVDRNLREIEALSTCENEYIARMINNGTFTFNNENYQYIVEEFYFGGTLIDRLTANQILGEEVTFNLGTKLLKALICLGDFGYVHRDIKPTNILFRDETFEKPILTDFGIVRFLGEESLTATYYMSGPGTPGYASPEQMNNEKNLIDWRTDQFSLGIMLSICSYGIHPYGENNVAQNIAERKPLFKPFLEKIKQNKLTILAKMVQAWPSYRYNSRELLIKEWINQWEE